MQEYKQNVEINITEDQTIVELSTLLQKYDAEVFLINRKNNGFQEVNVKSLLGLVTLRLQNGINVTVRTTGKDAEQAAQEVVSFLTKATD